MAAGLLPARAAWDAAARGTDIYLFLAGMMLLAELARAEGLFDWLAGGAARAAAGSPKRLFALLFAVSVGVTIFLSNDATAVVLTPAVAAAARRAGVTDKLPYLFICAIVANAASFVLPISNPANLVLYRGAMPPLGGWLHAFGAAACLSIGASFVALYLTQRGKLVGTLAADASQPILGRGGILAALGLAMATMLLLTASLRGWPLGPPTAAAGLLTLAAVWPTNHATGANVLRRVSWSVLPLVAGLFVLMDAVQTTGLQDWLARGLRLASAAHPLDAGLAAGLAAALVSNLINNLPAGLLAASCLAAAHPPAAVSQAVLIGIDLGPNLAITGSLATLLWLAALRREGIEVGFWQFCRIGIWVMPPALLLSLAAVL